MNTQINNIRKTRMYLLNMIKDLDTDQLNRIPQGFNNNIIWNLAHLIASEQGLCYVRAGLATGISEKYYLLYRGGTKPEQFIDSSEISVIKDLLFTSLDQLEKDYDDNIFTGYSSFATRYGIEISNINEALGFILFHEGLHSGVISALKKVVG